MKNPINTRSTSENLEVIFEDNHFIAVNKKSGDIVQGDKTGDEPLSEIIKHYLKAKYDKPGNVFCGVIHRIDRPVTGVVLFAKTSKALSRMSELFRTRDVQKTYWAVVKNKPPKHYDVLIHYLVKNEKQNKSKAHTHEVNDGKRSELSYELIAEGDNYSLLKILPLTGRHHQIRSQLAAIGCPIKGDLKYGFDRSNKDGSICLHARQIDFQHPVNGEQICITAEVPNHDNLWKDLAQLAKNA